MFSRLRNIHYAWIVLIAVMVVNTVSLGIRLSFGVFVDPLSEEHHWSHSAISLAYTMQYVAAVPIVLVIGRVAEKTGSRLIVLAGAVFFTIGMLLCSTVNEAWQFELYYGFLIGGLGTAAFTVILPVLLTQWFNKRLGLAIGLMWTSLSTGPLLFNPLMTWSIQTAGWQRTFMIIGLASGVLMAAFALLLVERPRDKGLAPLGGEPTPVKVHSDTPSTSEYVPAPALKQVMRTRSFWAMIGVHTFGCIGHTIPLALLVSMATFSGIPEMAAAGMMSALSVSSLISRFGSSLVAEGKGGRFTLSISMAFQFLPSLLLLSGNHSIWLFYAFAILFGIGYGGEMVGFPIFNQQYYTAGAPLGAIYAAQMAGAMFGMGIGAWLGGMLFDMTGSYTLTIMLSIGASAAAMFTAMVLPSYRKSATPVLEPALTRE